jgi:hypothetical protein
MNIYTIKLVFMSLLMCITELARSLVVLGCEVYVISPYYNYGKDGKTPGYLEKEEFIKWERNITTFIGEEKVEVGVHSGVEFGVKHYFLHHFTYLCIYLLLLGIFLLGIFASHFC